MEFDSKYASKTTSQLGLPNSYSFKIEPVNGATNELGNPPVLMLVDFSTRYEDRDMQEQITRYSLHNRRVEIFCQENVLVKNPDYNKEDIGSKEYIVEQSEKVSIGSFIMNQIDVQWDSVTVLCEHPLAMKALIDNCTAYHLKNLFPSQS
jgi:hypothetical protein